jgi:serine/threonine protein kinase
MKDLRHPHIISLVDSFIESNVKLEDSGSTSPIKEKGFLHIIMDYAENGDVY